ncbi:hypothetical protein GWL_24740 [Herbaspirillum sp. GW103]|nr:hypothetical protein GWL_24740 [Herbaspirillum sp. GW103]
MRNRHGNVLLLATGVSETEVDKLDFVVLHHLQNLCGRPCHANLLKRGSSINWGVEPFFCDWIFAFDTTVLRRTQSRMIADSMPPTFQVRQ